jgi:hypothetical protein
LYFLGKLFMKEMTSLVCNDNENSSRMYCGIIIGGILFGY